MVFFTCNECGQAIKKAHVDKHYLTQCRNCNVLSCMDCGKDFYGDDYKQHTQCISENEKYGGKGYQAQQKPNKGEAKQEQWLQSVRESCKAGNISNRIKGLLERIAEYPNVPRKKTKFVNFVKNSVRVHDPAVMEQIWNVFSAASTVKENPQSTQSTTDINQSDLQTSQQSATATDIKEQPQPSSTEKKSSKKEKHKKTQKEKDATSDSNNENSESSTSSGVVDPSNQSDVNAIDKAEDTQQCDETDHQVNGSESPKKKKKKKKSPSKDEHKKMKGESNTAGGESADDNAVGPTATGIVDSSNTAEGEKTEDPMLSEDAGKQSNGEGDLKQRNPSKKKHKKQKVKEEKESDLSQRSVFGALSEDQDKEASESLTKSTASATAKSKVSKAKTKRGEGDTNGKTSKSVSSSPQGASVKPVPAGSPAEAKGHKGKTKKRKRAELDASVVKAPLGSSDGDGGSAEPAEKKRKKSKGTKVDKAINGGDVKKKKKITSKAKTSEDLQHQLGNKSKSPTEALSTNVSNSSSSADVAVKKKLKRKSKTLDDTAKQTKKVKKEKKKKKKKSTDLKQAAGVQGIESVDTSSKIIDRDIQNGMESSLKPLGKREKKKGKQESKAKHKKASSDSDAAGQKKTTKSKASLGAVNNGKSSAVGSPDDKGKSRVKVKPKAKRKHEEVSKLELTSEELLGEPVRKKAKKVKKKRSEVASPIASGTLQAGSSEVADPSMPKVKKKVRKASDKKTLKNGVQSHTGTTSVPSDASISDHSPKKGKKSKAKHKGASPKGNGVSHETLKSSASKEQREAKKSKKVKKGEGDNIPEATGDNVKKKKKVKKLKAKTQKSGIDTSLIKTDDAGSGEAKIQANGYPKKVKMPKTKKSPKVKNPKKAKTNTTGLEKKARKAHDGTKVNGTLEETQAIDQSVHLEKPVKTAKKPKSKKKGEGNTTPSESVTKAASKVKVKKAAKVKKRDDAIVFDASNSKSPSTVQLPPDTSENSSKPSSVLNGSVKASKKPKKIKSIKSDAAIIEATDTALAGEKVVKGTDKKRVKRKKVKT